PRSTTRHYESTQNTRKRLMGSFIELSDDNLCEEDGGSDDCGHFGDKKRRLTFEQVKTLERSFEVGNKLDPERKMQLAMGLGLQPRQIAVWFQNRRARWKNKQLEKDYDALKHDHDLLKTDYDSLLQEHTQFKDEVQRLKRELMSKEGNLKVRGSEFEPVEGSKSSALFNPIAATCATELTVKSEARGKDSCWSEGSSALEDMDSPRTIESPLSPPHSHVPAHQFDYAQKCLEEETCGN
ncbi:hypothetical protein KI387_007748, partial [Taxus chinensis]